MGDVLQFKTKPVRNLYVVDNFHIVLATSDEEAISCIQLKEDTDKNMEVYMLDDQKEVNVIKSGKVEIILWEREPNPLEQLSFKLKVRDFIDKDLKNYLTPSRQDFIEDKGAARPKK